MNSVRRSTATRCFALGLAAAVGLALLAAGPSDPPQPSQYAPATDLLGQVAELREHLAADLEDESAYGEYQQQRIAMDANTLAALALVLGKHDEKNDLQGRAARIIAAARKLSGNVKDYRQARAALGELNQAFADAGQEGGKLQWKPVADVAELMKQVPIVNNGLRRGVEGRRFERLVDKNAGYAALLAALAQASAVDTSYCADEADEANWRRHCAQLRDAANEVRRQVRAQDQAAAVKGLAAVAESCDACHHAFDVK